MKNTMLLVVMSIFMLAFATGIVLADGPNGHGNDDINEPHNGSVGIINGTCPAYSQEIPDCEDDEILVYGVHDKAGCEIPATCVSKERIQNIVRNQERKLNAWQSNGTAPEGCTKHGNTLHCTVDGRKEIKILSGPNNGTIVNINGINMSTRKELYLENGTLYGEFGSEKRVKALNVMPDEIQDRLRERIKLHAVNGSLNVSLNDDGDYHVMLKKKARLFGFISTSEKVKVVMDPETGDTIEVRNPWWGFLATDSKE